MLFLDFLPDFNIWCILIPSIITKMFNSFHCHMKLWFQFFWFEFFGFFFDICCWRVFLQAPPTRLWRLVNQNKQQMLKRKSKKFKSEKLKSQFQMPMEWVEHFCDNGGDHDQSSVRIWRQSMWNQTFKLTPNYNWFFKF